MEPVRIGIIGVGQIGKSHLKTYAGIKGAEIVAVADINESEARRVAEEYRIPHVYTDIHNLLQRDDISAVDVCLHNNFHAPVTIAALRAGKHVYCEKPMAGAYVDAKSMYDAAKETGQKLSIQLATLFKKETKIARRLIDAGKLGRIYHARSTGYRRRGRPYVDGYGAPPFVKKEISGGGALFDMGVYHIAELLYLLDLPTPQRISGQVYQETEMDPARRELSGYNVEELAVGLVRFAGGLTMDIIEAWAVHMNPFEGSSLMGSRGGLRLQPLSYHTTENDMEVDSTFDAERIDWRWHQLRADEDAYDSPQHHWVAALQGRVNLLPTAEIALQTMLIQEGLYLSHRLGREVTAEEVAAASESKAVKL